MKPSDLIPVDARLRIEAAIAEAESATAGEIVVDVVSECSEYASVPWRLGVLVAAAASLGLALVVPELSLSAFFGAQLLGLAVGLLLGRLPAVRHHLVSDAIQEARVAERARRTFAEHGLARTTGRTGILIFVALLERRVVVLADEGIDTAMGPGRHWEEVVARVLDGLRDGRAADGVEAAVRRCGEILAAYVPAAAHDRNELRNAVVLED
jgi:putative membrane protein